MSTSAETPNTPPATGELESEIVEISRIPGLPKDFYNAAACSLGDEPDSPVLLLGRHVENTGLPGGPDRGPLSVAVLNNGVAESLTEVWRPESQRGDLLEDPRIVRLPDGRIFIGISRLAPLGDRYMPFPAVAVTTPEALLRMEFPDTHLVTGLGTGDQTTPVGGGPNKFWIVPGKNATPLKPNHAMFRPEFDNHRFVIFSHDESGRAQPLQYLEFPQQSIPEWGELRMGLTMPPAWLNEHEAILLVHGFNKPNGKLRYHIGSSRLLLDEYGQYSIDNISDEPLLTPESFVNLFPSEQVQRHPDERDALYLCGGIPIYDNHGTLQLLDTYPSVGDTQTAKATLSALAITAKWQRGTADSQTSSIAA